MTIASLQMFLLEIEIIQAQVSTLCTVMLSINLLMVEVAKNTDSILNMTHKRDHTVWNMLNKHTHWTEVFSRGVELEKQENYFLCILQESFKLKYELSTKL